MHRTLEAILVGVFGFLGASLGTEQFPNYGIVPALLGTACGCLLGFMASSTIFSFLTKNKLDNVESIVILSSIVLGVLLMYSVMEHGQKISGSFVIGIFSMSCVSLFTGVLWALCLENKKLFLITALSYISGACFFIAIRDTDPIEAITLTHGALGILFVIGFGALAEEKNEN